jgi:hypothetical protein
LPSAPFSADDNSPRLTEPSPLVSSLLKTSSAWARLVPPAPSAFSNSDLLTWPSPLASICENRSCSADAGLVDADVVVAADHWLCAANSALMVAGDNCENPLDPEAGAELVEAEVPALPSSSAALSPKPVDATEDDALDEVSDWAASSKDDTAPRANSMERTPTEAASCGFHFHADRSANAVPSRKRQ